MRLVVELLEPERVGQALRRIDRHDRDLDSACRHPDQRSPRRWLIPTPPAPTQTQVRLPSSSCGAFTPTAPRPATRAAEARCCVRTGRGAPAADQRTARADAAPAHAGASRAGARPRRPRSPRRAALECGLAPQRSRQRFEASSVAETVGIARVEDDSLQLDGIRRRGERVAQLKGLVHRHLLRGRDGDHVP